MRAVIARVLPLLAAAALLTGCAASAPAPVSTDAAPSPIDTPDTHLSTPSPTPSAPTARPTCEGILSARTVSDFASIGWTAREDPFFIDDLALPDGLQCLWADFSAPGGDHVQLFGWAPISAAEAQTAQNRLVGEGWRREEGASGTYVTADPQTAMSTDSDGYGMTYLFGDGWVTVSDTKQGLLLIERP